MAEETKNIPTFAPSVKDVSILPKAHTIAAAVTAMAIILSIPVLVAVDSTWLHSVSKMSPPSISMLATLAALQDDLEDNTT